ncbi:hypothetical protein [Streptomyces sp. NPDC059134]|uniref:hypothetical protein n=1 Tax=Streptomyces sp. NPDC059134 TaxID=3346738 RepID=UPI0036CCE566
MRVTQMAAGLTAAVTAVVGLNMATAGPAAAAEGSWRPYGNTNPITSSSSLWRCATTKTIASDVLAQVCAVRASGGSGSGAQAAVIVRNNRSVLYRTSAEASLWKGLERLGVWECASSGVGANSWSVCFGRTLTQSGAVDATGYVGGTSLGLSPTV